MQVAGLATKPGRRVDEDLAEPRRRIVRVLPFALGRLAGRSLERVLAHVVESKEELDVPLGTRSKRETEPAPEGKPHEEGVQKIMAAVTSPGRACRPDRQVGASGRSCDEAKVAGWMRSWPGRAAVSSKGPGRGVGRRVGLWIEGRVGLRVEFEDLENLWEEGGGAANERKMGDRDKEKAGKP
ncbi:hypothetical protein TRAPUB_1638 [Trametes pubescens]|uniref:Uncharacterized protein n=1 Tax=Trametes pubescens TaxID=154538 RepID=A0A1M2VIS3_TRAPU|nr:hypothetical protein TRAPUB_1638 [Trametes pubescens]